MRDELFDLRAIYKGEEVPCTIVSERNIDECSARAKRTGMHGELSIGKYFIFANYEFDSFFVCMEKNDPNIKIIGRI